MKIRDAVAQDLILLESIRDEMNPTFEIYKKVDNLIRHSKLSFETHALNTRVSHNLCYSLEDIEIDRHMRTLKSSNPIVHPTTLEAVFDQELQLPFDSKIVAIGAPLRTKVSMEEALEYLRNKQIYGPGAKSFGHWLSTPRFTAQEDFNLQPMDLSISAHPLVPNMKTSMASPTQGPTKLIDNQERHNVDLTSQKSDSRISVKQEAKQQAERKRDINYKNGRHI